MARERAALAVEKRTLENAAVPSVVYRVQTSVGARTFKLPVVEQRNATTDMEVREEDGKSYIVGHAAVFGRRSEDLGGFREVINPGAFSTVLDDTPDVRVLLNHDPNIVLGRTKNNTAELSENGRGLRYYANPPDTQAARDAVTLIKRGDIDQSSFAFSMGERSRERWEEDEDGQITRTIIEVDGLYDVSPVTFPAYPQTDATARELENVAPPAEEGEPEARTAEEAPVESTDEGNQEAQNAARLAELQAGTKRRLAIAKARSQLA
jgi:HK97 family phage prohead protease